MAKSKSPKTPRKKPKAKFIVIEGLDGSGSTTQCWKLRELLTERGWTVWYTQEPSNGPMGLMLRLILLGRIKIDSEEGIFEEHSRQSLALLFGSDRIDHLYHEILPALNEGINVICDRYYLSSYAYQLSDNRKNFEWLQQINSKTLKPDLQIYINTSVSNCMKRGKSSPQWWKRDLFERKDLLNKVADNYAFVIDKLTKGGEKIIEVDGNQPIDVVFDEIIHAINNHLPVFSTQERLL